MFHRTVYIGSDHGGFELKGRLIKSLSKKGYHVVDVGPLIYDAVDDYPDFVVKVCKRVLKDKSMGIMICKSGVGASMAANKINGIYAALCWNKETAMRAKKDENANVLCIGALFVKPKLAHQMAETWLEFPFEGGRHVRRLKKIKAIENTYLGPKHDSTRRTGR